ncbi:MAG: glycosyltransferase family 39 protein [Alphaproteobacteria bacterium]|nr:glycosyltransferase family 39 protein [Alphaproteobacteria bacterium]
MTSAHKNLRAFATITLGVCAVLMLGNTLSKGAIHDEEQYVFAGLLSVDRSLYSDFIYLQTPNLPLLLSAVFTPLDGYYFAAARLVSWAFNAGSMLIVFLLGRRLSGSIYAATILAMLFATSTLLLHTLSSARNDVMPCFFMLLSLLFLHLARRPGTPTEEISGTKWRAAILCGLCGLSAAVAVGTKISYGFLPVVVFVFLMFGPDERWLKRLQWRVIPYLAGGVIGAAPIIYYATTAWDQFYFQNFTYHLTAPIDWYTRNDFAYKLDLKYRIREAFSVLNRDAVVVGAVFVLFVLIFRYVNGGARALWLVVRDRFTSLFLVLIFAALVFSLLPTPAHRQYFVPVVPLLLLLVACMYAFGAVAGRAVMASLFAAIALVSSAPGVAALANASIKNFVKPPATERVNQTAVAMRQAIRAAGTSGKIATLSPIRVIDAGLSVYPEFASGPFFYRTADRLDAATVRRQNGVSAKTLAGFLDRNPPAAIFTGFETDSLWKHAPDAALEAYATTRGYGLVPGEFGGGRLFLRLPATKPARP